VELEEPCEASWNSGPGRRDPASTLRDVAWPKGSAIDDRGGPIVPWPPCDPISRSGR